MSPAKKKPSDSESNPVTPENCEISASKEEFPELAKALEGMGTDNPDMNQEFNLPDFRAKDLPEPAEVPEPVQEHLGQLIDLEIDDTGVYATTFLEMFSAEIKTSYQKGLSNDSIYRYCVKEAKRFKRFVDEEIK